MRAPVIHPWRKRYGELLNQGLDIYAITTTLRAEGFKSARGKVLNHTAIQSAIAVERKRSREIANGISTQA